MSHMTRIDVSTGGAGCRFAATDPVRMRSDHTDWHGVFYKARRGIGVFAGTLAGRVRPPEVQIHGWREAGTMMRFDEIGRGSERAAMVGAGMFATMPWWALWLLVLAVYLLLGMATGGGIGT